jgi:cytochrome c553
MHAVTLLLDGDDVSAELGRYFASLSPPAAGSNVSGDVQRGKQLYATCAACHGIDARGSEELNTPTMVGQHDWYLVRQLENFKSGARGGPQADMFGQQMSAIMGTLPDRQAILDVVAYIETL